MRMEKLKKVLALSILCLGVMPQLAGGALVLRFAVLGDAEPKPEAAFPHMEAAVQQVNAMAQRQRMDFVVGIGDIAHKGTEIQYEAAAAVLSQLQRPFYPIMGNEEHGSTVERYLKNVERWKPAEGWQVATRYVLEFDDLALVFASPDMGRDFTDAGIAWILEKLQTLRPKPVLLVVHAAQAGAYGEVPDKGVHHLGFLEVVAQPNLRAVLSGDLHMDMDRVLHSKAIGAVHYLHIPALERTKVPDKTHHQAMFRVFNVYAEGRVDVQTYAVGECEPLARHAYSFGLTR